MLMSLCVPYAYGTCLLPFLLFAVMNNKEQYGQQERAAAKGALVNNETLSELMFSEVQ
jgi:hypothetical protein